MTFRATRQSVAYVDQFVGAGRAFPKRGPAVDWIVREIRQQGLIRLRQEENKTADEADDKARLQYTTTMGAVNVAWIERLSGPKERPFRTRAEGIQWCIELAHRLRLKPPKDEPEPPEVLGEATAR